MEMKEDKYGLIYEEVIMKKKHEQKHLTSEKIDARQKIFGEQDEFTYESDQKS